MNSYIGSAVITSTSNSFETFFGSVETATLSTDAANRQLSATIKAQIGFQNYTSYTLDFFANATTVFATDCMAKNNQSCALEPYFATTTFNQTLFTPTKTLTNVTGNGFTTNG